eukprot:CAMPEP_0179084804 /NCGR_PEP_ID=MMETSP0796-20121207/38371_1 /TAXON_ID=73915 /ORGANISM="Pyrodinium bahamense, Strain pbaha01" /LENGTH=347 /DNA_ID=CAMNT_0020782231 /DNA_START=33 /DNA_END=1076 /DNA_ORIENTATION=-
MPGLREHRTVDEGNPSLVDCLKKLMLCATYIAVSTILIRFNKLMMQEDHFPFAMALSCFHMIVSSVLCVVLYLGKPSMFPAMESTKGQRLALMRWFFPISVCFAVMLFGSNKAYIYCSVTMLQFMKEANVMLVFLISCVVGLQSINRLRVVLIIWVIASATVSVSGDIRFSLTGILFQATSQVAECSRVVLGELILKGFNLDPLTYMIFVAPTSFAILFVATLCNWSPQIWLAFLQWWPLLLLNAGVAFILNLLVVTIIKEISAVGFTLTGLTKDIVIVVLSCIIFGEPITMVQWSAFGATLLGVGFWSLLKISPSSLPVQMLERALCIAHKPSQTSEATPIIEKKV